MLTNFLCFTSQKIYLFQLPTRLLMCVKNFLISFDSHTNWNVLRNRHRNHRVDCIYKLCISNDIIWCVHFNSVWISLVKSFHLWCLNVTIWCMSFAWLTFDQPVNWVGNISIGFPIANSISNSIGVSIVDLQHFKTSSERTFTCARAFVSVCVVNVHMDSEMQSKTIPFMYYSITSG